MCLRERDFGGHVPRLGVLQDWGAPKVVLVWRDKSRDRSKRTKKSWCKHCVSTLHCKAHLNIPILVVSLAIASDKYLRVLVVPSLTIFLVVFQCFPLWNRDDEGETPQLSSFDAKARGLSKSLGCWICVWLGLEDREGWCRLVSCWPQKNRSWHKLTMFQNSCTVWLKRTYFIISIEMLQPAAMWLLSLNSPLRESPDIQMRASRAVSEFPRSRLRCKV